MKKAVQRVHVLFDRRTKHPKENQILPGVQKGKIKSVYEEREEERRGITKRGIMNRFWENGDRLNAHE